MFMGLIPSGDDRNGLTHKIELNAVKRFNNNKEVGLTVSSALYSKNNPSGYIPETNYSRYEKFYDDVTNEFLGSGQFSTKYPRESLANYPHVKRNSIRIVDTEGLEAYFKSGKDFYIKGIVGIEFRMREKNKYAFAASSQDWWHKIIDYTRYEYVGPKGVVPKIEQSTQNSTIHMNFGYVSDPYDDHPTGPFGPEHLNVRADVTEIIESYDGVGLDEEILNTPIAPVSLTAGAAVGVVKEIPFMTSCKIKWTSEAGLKIKTEGANIVGANSQVYADSTIDAGLLNSKKLQGPRIELTTTQSLVYYPTQIANTGKIGGQISMGIETNHKVGNKNIMSPFIVIQIPLGRQIFDEFQDQDPIMKFGLRVKFKQKK